MTKEIILLLVGAALAVMNGLLMNSIAKADKDKEALMSRIDVLEKGAMTKTDCLRQMDEGREIMSEQRQRLKRIEKAVTFLVIKQGGNLEDLASI
jgi:hypothetical protein